MSNKFETAKAALDFITAGKATVSLKSLRTGKHFTFKIDQAKDNKDMFFVKVLNGSDNSWTGDWMFLGTIFSTSAPTLRAGKKGRPDAPSFKALEWTLENLLRGAISDELEIWHEGQCGMCRKPLTDPTSIEIGLGPICRAKL